MRQTRALVLWLAILFSMMASTAQEQARPALSASGIFNAALYQGLQWRNVGPFRGGRSVAVAGVLQNPLLYFMGSAGGGVWKTEDGGLTWANVSDGFLNTGSVGAIAVAASDPNIVYLGMGEHAVRGTMASHGDGVYKSTDGGRTWVHIGLGDTRHISSILIHPTDPDIVFVAAQGSLYGPGTQRGVYKSSDGGQTWAQVLYVDAWTGACDLSIDPTNPRILIAALWDHQRLPWQIRSGGPGSGLFRSIDGGNNWERLNNGLPKRMGKIGVDISRANPNIVYANIEAENGGVFRSEDGGKSWHQTSRHRVTIGRAWYFTKVCADPGDPETVYILNDPLLKSIDGGRTFEEIPTPHADQHDLWINPANPQNFILANDGGACITFNRGLSWSSQQNQPTGQFYRVAADNRFPYYLYGGQQDNSTVAIPSRTSRYGIAPDDWYAVSGCESAFLAMNPDNPAQVFGSCYQGTLEVFDQGLRTTRDISPYPVMGLGQAPRDLKYRFNWNAPVVAPTQNPSVVYFAANKVLRSQDGGQSWTEISPDLTRNDPAKQGRGGGPFTNEGSGSETYNTISYLASSPHQAGVLWAGTDDGLVHLSRDDGKSWTNVSPPGIEEALINSIEISPHRPQSAYVVATRYKFNDLRPMIFYTSDYGRSWKKIVDGIASNHFTRVVREDPKRPGLLYAGTEAGFYLSLNNGEKWHRFQLNLPVCPITDLLVRHNDLIAATSGRAFWILDDLGPLQQSAGSLSEGHTMLFAPRATVRFDAKTPAQPVAGLGRNPRTGVLIDYYLPQCLDSAALVLEVLDKDGNLLRRYGNQPDPEYVRYDGGPEPEPRLPCRRGINRFNWDLRRSTLPGIPKVFVAGSHRGSIVGPGDYRIRLVAAGDTLEQEVSVLPDPRLSDSLAHYARQQEVLQRLENTVRELHKTVISMRAVGEQVSALTRQLKKANCEEVIKQGKRVQEQLSRWEEGVIQTRQQTGQDIINFPNGLNAELINLIARADVPDPRLSQGVIQRSQDLVQEWTRQRGQLQRILERDLARFNQLYKDQDLPAVILPTFVD